MTRHDGILSGGLLENKELQEPAPRGWGRWFMDLIRPAIFSRGGPRKQIGRTAYLDGLRGFAAFLVYWHHHQLWPRQQFMADLVFETSFGYEGRYHFACLPIIRTVFTGGHFAVAMFFIISGYVLSVKPLNLIYAGDMVKLNENLASALFRRWMRLHIPVLIVSFLFMCSWHAFGIYTISPAQEKKFRDELWNFYITSKHWSFTFRTGGDPWFVYNFPTWSIPVEMKGSIIIYITLLAFSRITKNARLLLYVALMWYYMHIVDGWFGTMFIGGLLLGELDLLARRNELPTIITRFEPWKTPIFYTFLFVGVWLGGVPSHSPNFDLQSAPGWYYLSWFRPQAAFDFKWYYLFWGAFLLMASIPRIWWLKAFFETNFSQYLGRISFSLYMIHGPVLWTLADRLYLMVGYHRDSHLTTPLAYWVDKFPLNTNGPLGLELAFLAPHLIILPVTFWLAEIVTKLIDEPSNKFAHWVYKRVLPPSATPAQPAVPLRHVPREVM
ncbi:acyltransferase family-domain-containing protein [Bisporella sp. PMI_857]|nr:acyltransferase family-domain-containing protein [Bisporella sp. PMI_857]